MSLLQSRIAIPPIQLSYLHPSVSANASSQVRLLSTSNITKDVKPNRKINIERKMARKAMKKAHPNESVDVIRRVIHQGKPNTISGLVGDINRESRSLGRPSTSNAEKTQQKFEEAKARLDLENTQIFAQHDSSWEQFLALIPDHEQLVDSKVTRSTRRSLWRQRKKAAHAISLLKINQTDAQSVALVRAALCKLDPRAVASAKRSAVQRHAANMQELQDAKTEAAEKKLLNFKLAMRQVKDPVAERQKILEEIAEKKERLEQQRNEKSMKLQQAIMMQSSSSSSKAEDLKEFKVGNGRSCGDAGEVSPEAPSAAFHTLDSPSTLSHRMETPPQEKQGEPSPMVMNARNSRQTPQSLSESLRASHIPTTGTYRLDNKTELDFSADVVSLKEQVQTLAHRLKTAFPEAEPLPYDVWKSENTSTLTTWLRILASVWEARVNKISEDEADILRSFVVDQGLGVDSAKRMKTRLEEMNKKRMAANMEEDIDMEEFEAQMSYLGAEPDDTFQREGLTESNEEAKKKTQKAIHVNQGMLIHNPFSHPLGTSNRPDATRKFSTSTHRLSTDPPDASNHPLHPTQPSQPRQSTPSASPTLPHLSSSGSAHMVSVSTKSPTLRTAIAIGTVLFSNPQPLTLIKAAALKKGDVLSVSRIAGIMAAKKCPDLIPLCHPIMLEHVAVDVHLLDSSSSWKPDGERGLERLGPGLEFGGVGIEAKVQCTGPTGVEMEALTAVMGAALTVVDMCKAVDKGMRVNDVRVVLKEGGRSGTWRDETWAPRSGE